MQLYDCPRSNIANCTLHLVFSYPAIHVSVCSSCSRPLTRCQRKILVHSRRKSIHRKNKPRRNVLWEYVCTVGCHSILTTNWIDICVSIRVRNLSSVQRVPWENRGMTCWRITWRATILKSNLCRKHPRNFWVHRSISLLVCNQLWTFSEKAEFNINTMYFWFSESVLDYILIHIWFDFNIW